MKLKYRASQFFKETGKLLKLFVKNVLQTVLIQLTAIATEMAE